MMRQKWIAGIVAMIWAGTLGAAPAATAADAQPRQAQKIVQTAGRDKLGDFAPEFARYNDDILFGEVWSRNDILSLRDRSIVTITALISSGVLDSSLKSHMMRAK